MLQSCSYATWSTVVLSISTQRLIFQWDKKIKYHYSRIQLYALFPQFLNCICTSSGAWQSVWYTYSALFLLIFVLSRVFKTGYIYSDYFPRICWRVICTTPSATWGGGREMRVSNENFKKTSICISDFVLFLIVLCYQSGADSLGFSLKHTGSISVTELQHHGVNIRQGQPKWPHQVLLAVMGFWSLGGILQESFPPKL